MQLNFSKPLVGKGTRRDASLEFQEKFKKVCSAAPVIHVKNNSSATVKTNFGEHQKGSPLLLSLAFN